MEFFLESNAVKNAANIPGYINKSLFTLKTGTRQVVCSKTITGITVLTQ